MSFFKSKNPAARPTGTLRSDHTPFIGTQAKLNVGKPNDKYEQEADAVADKVVNKQGLFGNQPFIAPSQSIQRSGEEGQSSEEIETPQEKPVVASITPLVQTKETETQDTKQDTETEEDDVQLSPENQEEEVQKKDDTQGGGNTSQLESQLNSSKGGGRPMDDATKDNMESGFGTDFSDVRIHDDSSAVQMNKDLGAKAFAHGNDIYFNEGNYNPSSREGQHLLAHELTHTVQQSGGKGVTQTKNNIQLSPLSDELSQLWTTQGKGVFYNRLRQVSPLSDPDLVTFVTTLQGDDRWLTQNIITHGRESGWPIHLKVKREMKGWGDSGGKGAVFNLLRAANGTQNGNMQLHFAINEVFGAGTDDLWLANNLIRHGVEANWPIDLKVRREMKGWGDSGGKGAVFDLLRTANGSEATNFALILALFSVFEAGSEDIWLANLLLQYGVEANWPIKLRIERDLKGWADSGGFAAVEATITAASNADKLLISTDAALLAIIRAQLTAVQIRAILTLLKTALTTTQFTTLVGHFATLTGVPAGKIRDTTAELFISTELVDRNTANHLINGTIRAYYIEDLTQPSNVNAVVTAAGLDPAIYTVYIQPGTTATHMFVQHNYQGFRRSGTNMIFGLRTLGIARWKTLLVHETNHALNGDTSGAVDRYKDEFRAYWVAEFRGVTNLNTRAAQIKAHILAIYPHIKAAYDSNIVVRMSIDIHLRPDGNTDNH